MARVIVNRIWQFHFGQGIVASSNDLGVMGDAPTHPELLDWLASELDGLRLAAQAAAPDDRAVADIPAIVGVSSPKAAKVDPDNALLWRRRQRRLDAEVVRDSILAVSGQLNPRMAGPGFYPTLPSAVLEGQSRPGEGWGKSDEREQARRSIYIFAKRSLGVPEIELLDAPDTTSSCEQRIVSTTGPQALAFLNGAFIHEQARHFAARLVAEAGPRRENQVRPRVRTGTGPAPAARRIAGRARVSRQSKSSRSRPKPPVQEKAASSRRAPQGPRGVLPGCLEYE